MVYDYSQLGKDDALLSIHSDELAMNIEEKNNSLAKSQSTETLLSLSRC